jgi:hypothetical protein
MCVGIERKKDSVFLNLEFDRCEEDRLQILKDWVKKNNMELVSHDINLFGNRGIAIAKELSK